MRTKDPRENVHDNTCGSYEQPLFLCYAISSSYYNLLSNGNSFDFKYWIFDINSIHQLENGSSKIKKKHRLFPEQMIQNEIGSIFITTGWPIMHCPVWPKSYTVLFGSTPKYPNQKYPSPKYPNLKYPKSQSIQGQTTQCLKIPKVQITIPIN